MKRASLPPHDPKKPVGDEGFNALLDPATVSVIDYYRKLRNRNLHGDTDVEDDSDDCGYAELKQEAIRNKYKHSPAAPGQIDFRDVLLFSLAWQSAARSLCAALATETFLLGHVRKRFGNLPKDLRQKAVTRYLREKFLVDTNDSNHLLSRLKWAS